MRNHAHMKELITLLLVVMLMMSSAVSADAAANTIQNGWLNYSSGGYISVPLGFSSNGRRGNLNGYAYDFNNSQQKM